MAPCKYVVSTTGNAGTRDGTSSYWGCSDEFNTGQMPIIWKVINYAISVASASWSMSNTGVLYPNTFHQKLSVHVMWKQMFQYRNIGTENVRCVLYKFVYKHDTTSEAYALLTALGGQSAAESTSAPTGAGTQQVNLYDVAQAYNVDPTGYAHQFFKVSKLKQCDLKPGDSVKIHDTHKGLVFPYGYWEMNNGLAHPIINKAGYTTSYLFRFFAPNDVGTTGASPVQAKTSVSLVNYVETAYYARVFKGMVGQQRHEFRDTSNCVVTAPTSTTTAHVVAAESSSNPNFPGV